MHAFLTLVLPSLGMLGAAGALGYQLGGHVTTTRIMRSLKNDRGVAIAIIEDLAGRWGVKIEHQETPGAP